ncbi:hypothetical protein B0H17DRAFT_1099935 [Mycena rosella]|uniref:Uncharacterized protein n=1 Tax=Mycena rosella TaxID=1033263 RepID=A0AAD7CQL8_MYCRO|nr:hypothetical protein B0H17DRAFT_1099935 [Mycena rosella]
MAVVRHPFPGDQLHSPVGSPRRRSHQLLRPSIYAGGVCRAARAQGLRRCDSAARARWQSRSQKIRGR